MACYAYHQDVFPFKTIYSTVVYLLSGINGNYGAQSEMYEVNTAFAIFFTISYTIFFLNIFINMFLIIVKNNYMNNMKERENAELEK